MRFVAQSDSLYQAKVLQSQRMLNRHICAVVYLLLFSIWTVKIAHS